MRRLIWIPILHTAADLGSAAVEAERLHGKQQWQALQQQLTLAWNELTGRLQAMHLNYARVRIYQDGLPIAGDAGRAAVAELAARGSHNHALLLLLVQKGAILEATEDPSLLLQELALLREHAGPRREEQARRLLSQRDSCVAGRINATARARQACSSSGPCTTCARARTRTEHALVPKPGSEFARYTGQLHHTIKVSHICHESHLPVGLEHTVSALAAAPDGKGNCAMV